jgi:lipid II:glycine glycyltransferase (peptidoglycan interpeptide bridge formation enzyme)
VELLPEPRSPDQVPLPEDSTPGGGEPFLQSRFWGRFKAAWGWRDLGPRLRVELEEGKPRELRLLVLIRRLGGPFSFAYLPHGPALDYPGPERAGPLLLALARSLRAGLPWGCLFIRFDPPWAFAEAESPGGEDGEDLSEAGATASSLPARPPVGLPLRRAAADVQPPDSVILGLERSDEELLAGMKPKWRYNIRLAAKKGVVVKEEGAASLGLFYELYEATARRDRIALHPRAYYERLFSEASTWQSLPGEPRPDLRLWVARHEGKALAAIITLFHGRRATYLYGASSDEGRSLMPAYALQWEALRAAREAGCAAYDFYGIPPTADEAHPMAGLYRFKTGFGGSVIHYAGSLDLPLRPLLYAAFRGAEAARTWWFKVARKKLGGRPSA